MSTHATPTSEASLPLCIASRGHTSVATRECRNAISFLPNAKMAIKIIFWSCVVAVFGYFAYQELTFVTDSISVQEHIPAKRSDVFRLLLDPEFVPRKFQPLW